MANPTTDHLAAKAGETVEAHKTRVMEATRAHAEAQKVAARATTTRPAEGFPKSPSTPSNIPEFMKDKGVVPVQEPPIQKAPDSSATPAVSGNGSPANSGEPEWQKVAREKGWKTPEDAIRSYQSLETEFHRRNAEAAAARNAPPPYVPPVQPSYQMPYPQVPSAPPAYRPPVYPQSNLVQEMADKYGIPVEDAKRLLPFVGEVANGAAQMAALSVQQRYEPVVQDLTRRVQKQDEMMEVANDPAMRVPRVQYEVNRILSENPSIFQLNPQPLKYALDVALRSIAQESLRADPSQNGGQGFPTTPPITAGSGTTGRGGGAPIQTPANDMSQMFYSLKTAQEKKEFLQSLGVAPQR